MSIRHTRATAQTYRPTVAASTETRLPPSFANEPWAFIFYADQWEFIPKIGFLPALGRMLIKDGVNGVYSMPGGSPLPGGAVSNIARKGGTVIAPGSRALGEWADYIDTYDVNLGARTGKHYCLRGVEYEQTGVATARPVKKSGQRAYNDFRIALMRSGLISDPPMWALERLCAVAENEISRLHAESQGETPRARAVQERLDAMREEIARLFPDDEGEPEEEATDAPQPRPRPTPSNGSAEVAKLIEEAALPIPQIAPAERQGKPSRREPT